MTTSSRNRFVAIALLGVAGVCPLGAVAIAAQPAASEAFTKTAQKPNGSGVDVRYRLLDKPVLGQTTRVEIAFGKVTGPDGATVELSTDAGLRLDSATSANLPADESTLLTVSVVPQQEGLAYLNVFTKQRGATSSTSIAIQTGSAGSRKSGLGKLKDAADGGKILSMPVK